MAENLKKERLTLVHCDTLFKTSEEAKQYVIAGDLITIKRPAKYAEPMVLKYGDEANPNILLAIGSVGDGETPSMSNKVFFIDIASIEESIKEIEDELNNGEIEQLFTKVKEIIKSCGLNEDGTYSSIIDDAILKNVSSLKEADKALSDAIQNLDIKIDNVDKSKDINVIETNTIKPSIEKTEEGITLSNDVKLSPYETYGNCNYKNIILSNANGLYANVRVSYNAEDNELFVGINDEVNKISLPKEKHVQEANYDTKTESLILTMTDGEKIVADFKDLIGEWTVEGEYSKTPIVLTKEPVTNEEAIRGNDLWQDILRADIRLADEKYPDIKNNILKRYNNDTLYVKGTADNIKYYKDGEEITVQEAIDSIDCNVSNNDGNIIFKRSDGIFANVELEYNASKNSLTFSKTEKDGSTSTKELTLSNISFLENIYYDSLTEEIVILYKDATGSVQEIRVPVSSLLEEWEVDNTNHTVTLTKTDHQTAGKDKLSADVNIATTSDNILRVVNHGLHVKGTSDNIKHNNGTVKDALDLLNGADDIEGSVRNLIKKESNERQEADSLLQSSIETEKERALAAEAVLDGKILENTNAITSESNRAKAAEEANKNSIDSEILRAKSEEKRIEDKFDTAISKQGTVNSQFTESIKTLDGKIDSEISRSTAKDTEFESNLNAEIQRATGEEKRIETAFNSYKENSERQHTELGNRVTSVEASLTKETEDRIKNDQTIGEALSNEIVRAKGAEGQIASDLSVLTEKVNSNSNNINTINTGLSSLNSKIDNEITRAKEAENANKLAISEEQATRENKDTELKGLITANTNAITSESNRAKAVETLLQQGIDENKGKIEAEIQRATAAEKVNADAITALDKKTNLVPNNSGTINLTKTPMEDGNGYTLSGQVNVSQELGNIINSDGSALKATVDLVYDGNSNTLTLKTSNNADKVITLNQGSIITSIRYESSTKELVITYQTADGQTKEVKVNVADLFNEISVENPAENAVTLKMTDKSDGSQIITADVNVSTEPNNLLQKVTGNLYVSNSASGIKFEDGKSVVDKFNSLNQTINDNKSDADSKYSTLDTKVTLVENKVDSNTSRITALETKDTEIDGNIIKINESIAKETNDRTSADTALGVRIDSLTSKVDTEISNRTQADNDLSGRISTLETNLPKEVEDRTNADNVLRSSIQSNTELINNEANKREKDDLALGVRIDNLQSNLSAEVQRATEKENALSDAIGRNTEAISNLTNTVEQNKKDLTCTVKNTESIALVKEPNSVDGGYILSGNVNISAAEGNIISKNGALFASVDLQYNSASNTLTLLTSNNASKEIKLSIGSIIKSITYDSDNKRLVIIYIDENQEEKTVYVPVTDLYNEWVVEDRNESVIKLTKVTGTDGQPDVLKADLKLATPESGNLLQNTNGNLYASNKALDIKLSDHVGTNVEAAIVDINSRLTSVEDQIGDYENLDELKRQVEQNTSDIAALETKTNIETIETNSIKLEFSSTENSSSLKADSKISSKPNNLLSVEEDGLMAFEDYDFGTY